MIKIYLFSVACLIHFSLISQPVKWQVDKAHTKISFNVTHLLISEVTGFFHEFEGEASSDNEDNFMNANVSFKINTKSIDTDNEERDRHLRSDDFFAVEKYPEMTFKSKTLKKIGDKRYKLTGDLTIRGIAKTVSLEVKHGGTIDDQLDDNKTKAGFKITGIINRYDFGLKWNIATKAETFAVSDQVEIVCNVRLVKK